MPPRGSAAYERVTGRRTGALPKVSRGPAQRRDLSSAPLSRRRAIQQAQDNGGAFNLAKRIIKKAANVAGDVPLFQAGTPRTPGKNYTAKNAYNELPTFTRGLDEQSGAASVRRLITGKGGGWDAVAAAGFLPVGRMARLARAAKKPPLGAITLAQQAETGDVISFGERSLFEDMQAVALPAPADKKFRPGRLYSTRESGAADSWSDPLSMRRLTLVTDPETGVSFLAPKSGVHHEQVEQAAKRMGFIPGGKYLQGEVYDPTVGSWGRTPARLSWGVYSTGGRGGFGDFGSARTGSADWAGEPTRRSAFAQARILKQLRDRGRRGYVQE